MNKPLLGLLLGAVLGVLDGLTAWFTPEVRSMLGPIVIGSTVKGLLAGVITGLFARKVASVPKVVAFGTAIALLFAWAVAAMPDPSGKHYYFEIMLPGAIVGAIVGFATARYGRAPRPAAARA